LLRLSSSCWRVLNPHPPGAQVLGSVTLQPDLIPPPATLGPPYGPGQRPRPICCRLRQQQRKSTSPLPHVAVCMHCTRPITTVSCEG
jgi:hypothetical protein